MDINSLTYGQMKEIAKIFHGVSNQDGEETDHPLIGQFCILRCRDAGVHAGTVAKVLPGEIMLTDSRRMWQWKSDFTLSEASIHGIDPKNSRIAEVVPVNFIRRSDICEHIPCTKAAEKTIMDAPLGKKG